MTPNRLAVQGGNPAFPDGPPDWPVNTPQIQASIQSAIEQGLWGKYDSELGDSVVQKLRSIFEVEHAMTCSSGTIAVELGLRGVGVKAGDEVLIAAYDFPGNFRAIEAIGARPVLVDVAPNNWLMDLKKIASAVSDLTRAVIVSHLHGYVADMNELRSIAKEHSLSIVEDVCQAPGALLCGKPVGNFGDVSVLSFGGSKLLSAGRGGAILCNDSAIIQRAKIFSDRGNEAFPLSQLQAAALLPQLDALSEVADKRHQGILTLYQLLAESPASHLLGSPSNGQPFGPSDRIAAYKFPLLVPNSLRRAFIECLNEEGIAAGEGFRGFTNRTERRCRKPMELTHSRIAAEQSVLIHHPVFLESEDYLTKLSETITNVFQFISNQIQ